MIQPGWTPRGTSLLRTPSDTEPIQSSVKHSPADLNQQSVKRTPNNDDPRGVFDLVRIFRSIISTLASKKAILVVALLLGPTIVLFSVLKTNPQPASALAITGKTLNFQGRLLSNTGSLVADGYYNIEFKLYNDPSSTGSSQGSCTGDANCQWTEVRYDTDGAAPIGSGNDYRVRVTNGYFSVVLGDVNNGGVAFPSTIDWSQQLYLTMRVGGSTQTASPTWDTEMTPRIQTTAVPLAFMANNVNSGNTYAASTNSNDVTVQSGNATGTTSNSGNVGIDAGTATGTKGSISIGIANAAAITIGRSGLTTVNAGALQVGGNLTIGNALTSVTPVGYTLQSTGGLGSNIAGAAFTLAGGQGTGTGVGGNLVFQTAKAGTTGSSLNTLQTILTLSGTNGSASFQNSVDSTSAFQVQNAAGVPVLKVGTTNLKVTTIGDSYIDSKAWTIRASAGDDTWNSVAYGNGIYVAVSSTSGTGNEVMTSPDGITWTMRTSSTSAVWNSVTYGNGLFVAVSSTAGTGNEVMTSPDGITWTARTSSLSASWNSVTYGNNVFVAVSQTAGTGNEIMTSPDGTTWTTRTSSVSASWKSVTYGNGLFVAVSSTAGTGNEIMTSPDGTTWTTRTSASSSTWSSVTYGNSLYVAVSAAGSVMTSPDGTTWTSRTAASANNWRSVTYGSGLYVAVSTTGTSTRVMTSPDGTTWTTRTDPVDNSWNGVGYGNGVFIAVGSGGVGNNVMTAYLADSAVTDSTTAFQIQGSKGSALTLDVLNSRLEVVGDIVSKGTSWTVRTSAADNSWSSVAYGNGIFVAVASTGTGNRVMTSPDGIIWTIRTSAADNSWSSVTYGNGLFVAVAYSGTGNRVMTSPDGVNWTIRTSAADNAWNGITYANGLFVAAACGISSTFCNNTAGNRIMTSPDGITWTSRTSSANNMWDGITYGNGLFVTVASDGSITNSVMTSPDGINWTTRTAPNTNDWESITYGNGLFVAISEFGISGARVMTSPDGITWTIRSNTVNNAWSSVAYGNGTFVSVSVDGTGNHAMTSGKQDYIAVSNNNKYQGGLTVNGSSTFTSDLNSSTAFQVQNSAGTNVLSVDTSNSRLEVVGDIISKGTSWTSRTGAANLIWNSITYGNGLYVAVASSGTGNRVMTSPDGINWTARTSAADNKWNSVVYGNGLFVAVSNDGTGNRVMTSPDGITWTIRTSAADNDWMSVTYGNGLFVAVACGVGGTTCDANAGNRVMTSPDGINWTLRVSTANVSWYSVTYGNGVFVAVSYFNTAAMSSPDGITWTARTLPSVDYWDSITYGNGLFVAVALGPTTSDVATSPDGITWTSRTTPTNGWNSVTYGNGLFVAVTSTGTGNRVMTSPDGINWTSRISASDDSWHGVVYGNGMFVAIGTISVTNNVMTSGKQDYIPVSNNNNYQGGLTVHGSNLFQSDANSVSAFQIQNSSGTSLLNVDSTNNKLTVATDIIATGASTATTGTTSATPATNTTTVILTAAGSFANNDIIFIDNTSGQDYYTRIVSGGGTTTLTVSPAVSYLASATVTKYTAQSIGATSTDYTTLNNRFFQGYFTGGIVTGAGSTVYSDGRVQSSNTLNINAVGVTIQNTADSTSSLLVQNSSGSNVLNVDTTSNSLSVGSTASIGLFKSKADYTTGSAPGYAAVGDFNKDGYSDMVVSNFSSNTVSIFMGAVNGTFAAKVDYTTGSSPTGIVTGDFNNDGKLDFAVVNSGSATFSIFINSALGSAQFGASAPTATTKVDYTTVALPFGIVATDLNNDGKLDIAVASAQTTSNVSIFLNSGLGSGQFGAGAPTANPVRVDYSAGSTPKSIAAADFNSDGKVDLVTSNSAATTVSILFNTSSGAGLFGASPPAVSVSTTGTVGTTPLAVAVGDFNKDGKPDIAAVNYGSATVSILLNTTGVAFATKVDYATGTNPKGVVVGDFNKDGLLDMAVTNMDTSTLSTYLNTGSGVFASKVDYTKGTSSGTAPQFGIAADFNNDGNIDLASTNNGGNTISVLLNAELGFAPTSSPTLNIFNNSINDSLSISGQGAKQLVRVDGQGNTTIGGNTANLFDAKTDSPVMSQANSVAAGDFNKDGIQDIIVAMNNGYVGLLFGNGIGGYGNESDTNVCGGGNAKSVVVADFNRDGYLDAAATCGTVTVTVLINNGTGTFATGSYTISGSGSYIYLAAGDFNGDGKVDLAVPQYSSGAVVSVLINSGLGTGQFSATTTPTTQVDYTTGANPEGITTGDFNADGKLDMAITNAGGTVVSVYLNTGAGSGQFGASPPAAASKTDYTVGTQPTYVQSADLNKDGKLDLVIANNTNQIGVLINTGSSFAAEVNYTVANSAFIDSFRIGDLDKDGNLDVITANDSSNTVSVLLGTSTGTFGANTDYATGTRTQDVAIIDLDGDGDLDVISANLLGSSISVLSNTSLSNKRLSVLNTLGTASLFSVSNNGLTVNTTQTNNGNLVVGGQADVSPAAVTLVGTAGTFGSDTSVAGAFSSAVYNGKLYISTKKTDGSAIYRGDGKTWSKVTDSTSGKIISGDTANIDASVLSVYNGKLYAGTQTGTTTGAVYAYDGTTWTLQLATRGTFGSDASVEGVSSMAVYGTKFYLVTRGTDNAGIYRYDGSTTWTRLNTTLGKGLAEATADIDGGPLVVYGGYLWWGTITGSTTARIYRLDSSSGTLVMTLWNTTPGQLQAGITAIPDITTMQVWNGWLWVGTGATNLAEVYVMQGSTGAAGASPFGTTSSIRGRVDSVNDATDIDAITAIQVYNGRMYVATKTVAGDAGAVYEYITGGGAGGQPYVKAYTAARGTFGSQTAVDQVDTLIAYGNSLYIGTEEGTTGAVYTYTKTVQNSFALQFATDTSNSPAAAISYVGNTQADSNRSSAGSFLFSSNINTTSGSYDLAEDYPTRDDTLAAGDIVSISPSEEKFVQKGDAASAKAIVGVYSTNPALRLSQSDATIDGARAVPVALAGRVPVKVSAENGPIVAGDPITISPTQPGVGVKAISNGRIVGMSMGSFSGDGTGSVTVFINPSFYNVQTSGIAQGMTINGSFIDLNTSGLATIDTLVVNNEARIVTLKVSGNAEFGGDIKVVAPVNTRAATIRKFIASEPIEPGKVVILDENNDGGVLVSTQDDDTRIIGVAVTQAIHKGDEIEVAVGGAVQVSVTNTIPLIKPGSLVVSSSSGSVITVQSPQPGSILGKSTAKTDANNRMWILITLD
ncbi:MAG: hypothetical protein JWO47_115 [Candidatus Saccharibacteria bacterium]|nr:hypothetical protein [Candidatus Saccharibacteria bacterium]